MLYHQARFLFPGAAELVVKGLRGSWVIPRKRSRTSEEPYRAVPDGCLRPLPARVQLPYRPVADQGARPLHLRRSGTSPVKVLFDGQVSRRDSVDPPLSGRRGVGTDRCRGILFGGRRGDAENDTAMPITDRHGCFALVPPRRQP